MNIIAQLQGGLGNQLFQYATARALAHQKQVSLLLDQSWFAATYENVTPRELLLDKLNTKGAMIHYLPEIKRSKRLRRIAQSIWPINPFIFVEKAPYQFDIRLSKSPAFQKQNLYLMGYFQSFRYFEDIKSILQTEITPKQDIDPHYQGYLSQIQSSQAAMVHVRRGDYIHLPSAATVHGFLGLEYYQKGMDILLDQHPQTQFFVFSDDIDWAKSNLPHQEKITFIQSINDNTAVIQELELMKHCKSHLIANSSLSWWAAWLSKSQAQNVICPKKWTNDSSIHWDDLLPSNWKRI